ncbi:galactosylgalactosylxylosylprotein 3-beta-glucuronosyltransferase S isoform X2 [Drosophila grimshawi]|uniref:Galactosylgalactosylxylosylprotein 3-beta-glucuronosyltransferase n=1 Tax=Drosophila grimshawi TaxID=7222 RepID=B4JCE7_DROGR|nr:galactosylgalactosylxylosylprotein 3-beta-glucuronosyltransferase S isoform X2 [Drosophila grimshawi]EDW03101.1 GH10677 [Drosophila grimshawi]
MPSAHYQALAVEPQASDDNDNDEEELVVHWAANLQPSSSSHNHARYHKQLATSSGWEDRLPTPGRGMAPRLSRRRYWMLLVVPLFIVCYFVFSSPLLLGQAGGDGDDDDANNFEPHNGIDGTTAHALNEPLLICSDSSDDHRLYIQDKPRIAYAQLPIIYFVTPTYPRREQIPELTRLAYTLLHVPRLHWLVANDQEKCDTFLDTLLSGFGIPFTHMASPMPSKFRKSKPAPRGVANRRAALLWLQQHNLTNGVLYFGDDDNTYDLRLFSEIRQTQRVSMFPVGLIADYAVSGPVVRDGKVVAFLDSWVAGRRWPVDMAGFAVNLAYMSQYPNVNMPYKPGYEEDLFLRSIGLRIDQIEPRGNNCTDILVWHTQTKSKKSPVVNVESKYLDGRSNLGPLFRSLKLMGVASASDTAGHAAVISKNGKGRSHSYFLS